MITISVITIRHFLKIKAHHFQKIKRAFLISIFSSKVRNRVINCKLPILALSLSTIKISSPMLVFLLFYFSFLLLNLFWSIIISIWLELLPFTISPPFFISPTYTPDNNKRTQATWCLYFHIISISCSISIKFC